jgi:hypothetical protein
LGCDGQVAGAAPQDDADANDADPTSPATAQSANTTTPSARPRNLHAVCVVEENMSASYCRVFPEKTPTMAGLFPTTYTPYATTHQREYLRGRGVLLTDSASLLRQKAGR